MTHHNAVTAILFLSLGLDTFGVAVGLGLSGLDRSRQMRFGFTFALAEGIMPLVGLAIGGGLAHVIGDIASYLAIVLLMGVGVYSIWESFGEEEERSYDDAAPARLLALALSVSIDELAVGFSLGLLGVPIVLAILYIAVQAFVVTLIGTALGRRLGAVVAERAELVSGAALSLLALFLLGEKLLGT